MIAKTTYESGLAAIYSTAGRKVIGPAAPKPVKVATVAADEDQTQYSEAPRVFSKLKLVVALRTAGAWTQVKDWLEENDYWDLFTAAQTFREDYPAFSSGFQALRQLLGWSAEQAEAVLAASEADD